jgi:ribosome assembly protein YihI (activator of Der GTPase)
VTDRDDDLRMLRAALELTTLEHAAREAFGDMLDGLGARRELSAKQRAWLRKVLDDPDYENLISSRGLSREVKHNHGESAMCDAACPAWTPPSLRNLPKKPPKRAEGT